ncbi:MAG: hypothetical protein GYB39_05900 [Algicola sp.]|nr:hypothetical protein [Algicola sp.]
MQIPVFHKALSLCLTLVLLSHLFTNIYIISDFIINQDVIAKTLCVQKDAQKGCYGKCQLNKTLSQANDSQKETPITESKRLLEIVFIAAESFTMPDEFSANYAPQTFVNTTRKTICQYYDIDTPPPLA